MHTTIPKNKVAIFLHVHLYKSNILFSVTIFTTGIAIAVTFYITLPYSCHVNIYFLHMLQAISKISEFSDVSIS